jgi:hypothetical protein
VKITVFDPFSPKKSDHGKLVVQGWSNLTAERPLLHNLLFRQNDNGVLCDEWSKLLDSSYNRSAVIPFGTRLIHRQPLPFDIPS